MLEYRTDLAEEFASSSEGITTKKRTVHGVDVTEVNVSSDGERLSGRKTGKYISLSVGRVWEYRRNEFEAVSHAVADELHSLLPDLTNKNCILAAGLGNEAITSDSIGSKTVRKLLVTNHIKAQNSELFKTAGFGCVCAFVPGVLGQTGIESSEQIINAAYLCNAGCIVAVDSLAAGSLSRLCTVVQMSDTGISPGSGVYNKRKGITYELAGIPVIAVGVPTVVDASTLACDLIGQNGKGEELLCGRGKDLFITPKESDVMVEKLSRLISCGMNLAFHPKLTLDEIFEYTE